MKHASTGYFSSLDGEHRALQRHSGGLVSSAQRLMRACVLGAIFGLAACGGGDSASLLASAKDYLAKKDAKAAIIQIKNALEKAPNSPEGRYLLGRALLANGDFANAELELRKALELKYSAEEVVPQLANAMVGMGQSKKLLEEFGATQLTSKAGIAELQTALASAYSSVGKPDLSKAAMAAALAADPNFGPALISQVRLKAAEKDFDGALKAVEEIIAKDATNFDAWKLKGDVLSFGKLQPKEALTAYRKGVEIRPDSVAGHASVLAILLSQDDQEGAATQLALMKKVAPNHPQTRLIETQLAYQKRDFTAAREFAQQLLKVAPNNPKALQLAGAVEFQLKSFIQAETLLNKAVTASPDLVLARRMLIMTYLRSGQPSKALAALNQGLSKGAQADPEMDSIAGEVYLQNGDVKKAEEYFAKAAKTDPKNAKKRTSLAMAHLVGGKEESGFAELQEIASTDTGITADMALISAHLKRGNLDKALKAIDVLEKKQANSPVPHNLRGRTLLSKKDIAGARKSFERALAISPTYFPAISSLAALDLIDKKPEDAKKRFNDLVAKEPKNGQAWLALAELADRTSAPKEEVVGLIQKAIDANPTDSTPRMLLIEFYLSKKETRSAMTAAQSAVTALPENADLLDALGRVQQASGESNQALATFNKVAGLQPLSPRPQLRLADAYIAAKNKDGALQSLKKALDIKPDLLEAQRALAQAYLQDKKYSEALTIAKNVQKQRPKEPHGFAMEGEILFAQQKWDAAVVLYRSALKEAGNATDVALKLHTALQASSKNAEADKFADKWSKDHPKDVGFHIYLGDVAIGRKDYSGAEKLYAAANKMQPDNPIVMNNLAWVLGQQNKPGALELAEAAVKLAPQQPALMDTLAGLLSAKNDHAKALEWQKKAIGLQPDNPLFKLNLAKIQIKGGEKDLARKELEALAKLGNKFSGQTEVAGLLKTL